MEWRAVRWAGMSTPAQYTSRECRRTFFTERQKENHKCTENGEQFNKGSGITPSRKIQILSEKILKWLIQCPKHVRLYVVLKERRNTKSPPYMTSWVYASNNCSNVVLVLQPQMWILRTNYLWKEASHILSKMMLLLYCNTTHLSYYPIAVLRYHDQDNFGLRVPDS